MDNRIITVQGTTYTRVPKSQAKRFYLAGHDVLMCPVNLDPESPWRHYVILQEALSDRSPKRWDVNIGMATDRLCIDSQTGRYLAYYVDVDARL